MEIIVMNNVTNLNESLLYKCKVHCNGLYFIKNNIDYKYNMRTVFAVAHWMG